MSVPANHSPAAVNVSDATARTSHPSTDTVVAKLAALFSVLVIAAEIAGPAIGIPRGVLAPTVADFGNPDHLLQLSRNHSAAIVPWACALAGPYLALVVAIGWYRVLRHAGGVALCAVVLFYATSSLVVTGEALRMSLLLELPPAYAAASRESMASLLVFGATMNALKETLFTLGQMLGFGIGQILFGVAILRAGNVPRWLEWLSFVPAVIVGWAANLLKLLGASPGLIGLLTGIGFLVFMIWMASMAVVLFRWRPESR